MPKREWNRFASGHGYCAKRIEDGWLWVGTFAILKRDAGDNLWAELMKHYEWGAANAEFRKYRIVRVICEEAP